MLTITTMIKRKSMSLTNYSASFHPLTDDPWQQAYNQGSAEVLQALKSTFLDNPHIGTT